MLTQIYNGSVLLPGGRWLKGGSVIIEGHRIAEVCAHSRLVENADKLIDARGGYVMPGGIDMHVHGGGGRDFMEATREAFVTAAEAHLRHGTTGIFPSLAATSHEGMVHAAEVCTELAADPYSSVLGLHYEGPYFRPSMAGGQIPEHIRRANPDEYVPLVENFPCIKRWDASPELPGALDFGRFMSQNGVVAGLAHTEADYSEVAAAYDAGYSIATHFYNAMTLSHKNGVYKHEGTVEGVFLIDELDVEVIADGIHVPRPILKLIHKFKGAEHVSLVSDALACTASKTDHVFDPRVIIENGVGMLSDHSAIAGSVATMDRLIRTMALDAGIPLADVARMASETPARVMGVNDRKGSLRRNMDADIIIMDDGLQLTHVISMGREIAL